MWENVIKVEKKFKMYYDFVLRVAFLLKVKEQGEIFTWE